MHRLHLRLVAVACLLVASFPLTGCLFRTRTIERQLSNAPLKAATQEDLIDYVNAQASRIQSMQATVDIDTSADNPTSGKVTDYKEIRGYILARKPDMLRMKGLMPVVRNTAFDMVSDGKEFKLWIPPKNKFVVGTDNDANYQSDKRLENLRPQYIYNALLIQPIAKDEIAVLENGYETVLDPKRHRVDQPDYELAVIRKGPQGWYLSRRIQFSRTDLVPHRLRIYDLQGNVATDAHYQNFKDFNGISFPTTVSIERPREGYEMTLSVLKLDLNRQLSDDQFSLEQPPGAEVVRLGAGPNSGGAKSGAATPGSPRRVADARDGSN
jgi:outer membrane lipoprotein-sorting protein